MGPSMTAVADWMIYGANGYTGRLIAEEAVRRGLRPVLAGRNEQAIAAIATSLGCQHRSFALEQAGLAQHLAGMRAVLHCAGPFSATARPMMEACLASGCHYLDITGEIDVIEAAAALGPRSTEAGVMLLPAVGFDVVPSDCLAAALAQRMPHATQLLLAFASLDRISPGTAKTMLEGFSHGGRARVNGRIVDVPVAWKVREIPFRPGPRTAMTIPWGDVATAYYSTRIPNIETYAALPAGQIRLLRRLRWLVPWLQAGWIKRLLLRYIVRSVHGPSEAARARSRSSLWGQIVGADGQTISATLETLGGYQLTVLSSMAAVERVLAGDARPGFMTPALVFGKDFVLSLPDTTLEFCDR